MFEETKTSAAICGNERWVGRNCRIRSSAGLRLFEAAADSFATALHNLDDQWVASWCRTTNVVKRSHRHRLVVEGTRGTLVCGLGEFLAGARPDLASSAPTRKVPAGVGLFCSGQGTQYPGMTRPIYDANPVYREHLDTAAAALAEASQHPSMIAKARSKVAKMVKKSAIFRRLRGCKPSALRTQIH